MLSRNFVRGRIPQVCLDPQNVNKTPVERAAQIARSIHSATLGNTLPGRQSLIVCFRLSQTEADKREQISFAYDRGHQSNILGWTSNPKEKTISGPIQKRGIAMVGKTQNQPRTIHPENCPKSGILYLQPPAKNRWQAIARPLRAYAALLSSSVTL